MTTKALLLFIALTFLSIKAICQTPPKEFFEGINMVDADPQGAKMNLLLAVEKDSLFHGTYHFLGVLNFNERKLDSAIYYFKKSIALNSGNINHTKEMTYVRLINTYTYQHDFRNAFDVAWLTYKLYPDNNNIKLALQDLCLWSYYIKHGGLDASYLSPDAKDEYTVNCVPQEYLITRVLILKNEHLAVTGQALMHKNGAAYDVLYCETSKTKTKVELEFKLNWDMNKEFGGKPMPANQVISNAGNPIYERLGAVLATDRNADLKAEIKKLGL